MQHTAACEAIFVIDDAAHDPVVILASAGFSFAQALRALTASREADLANQRTENALVECGVGPGLVE